MIGCEDHASTDLDKYPNWVIPAKKILPLVYRSRKVRFRSLYRGGPAKSPHLVSSGI